MSSNKKGKDWYQETTDRILKLIEEKGKIPWLCPFPRNGGFQNTTGHAYRGINQLHLLTDSLMQGWDSVIYITTTELKNRKISFKGKSSCPIFKWVTVKSQAEREDEAGEKTEEEIVYLRLKYVGNVFNISQFPELTAEFQKEDKPENIIKAAQKIIDEMPNRPETTYFPGRAFYSPSKDTVNIPSISEHLKVSSAAKYYSTAFHEYAHSTGHKSRLNRKSLTESANFGTITYSKEELIAEFTAAFLCGEAGIGERTIENSAAYIKGWSEKLRENNRLLVEAIQNAQHAADYILNRQEKKAPEIATISGN